MKDNKLFNLFFSSSQISNRKFIFRVVSILLTISILLGLGVSYYAKKLAVKNLAHNDMIKTSELVFEVLYSKMEDGWDRDDLNYTISKLNQLHSGMKIESYRSQRVSNLYGDTHENSTIINDIKLLKAFKGIEQTILTDNEIRFLYPIKNEQKCLQCHTNSAIGDINGVIDITMPLTNLMIPLDSMIQVFMVLLILFLIAIFIGIYFILNRKFVNPMVSFSEELENICPYDINSNTIFIDSNISEIKKLESSFNDLLNKYKEAIKELQQKEKLIGIQSRQAAMGEMIGMIAHQWRQPITVIAMDVNNIMVDLELGTQNPEDSKRLLKHILKQTEHLSSTIDDFRNFFKPDKELVTVMLKEIIDETLLIIGKSLESHSIELTIKNNSQNQVPVYKRELIQVLLNIINNAKEALLETDTKNPEISFELKEGDEFTQIIICDNGGGIKEEIIDRVFEPYFSTKNEKHGTGIGLYMCQNIIQKHFHGSISVKNNESGATFTISIPRKQIATTE